MRKRRWRPTYFLLIILLTWINTVWGQPKNNEKKIVQNSTSENKKPNIIFILTDDLGWGDLGVFYQNQRKKDHLAYELTPNLDLMATSGAQLTDHYDAAPVCAPSRASILCGISQGHARVRDNQFDKALDYNHTMGTVMQKLGYATAVIGKWGEQGTDKFDENGSAWLANPLNRGFDYFFGYMQHIDGHQHYPKEALYTPQGQVWQNHTDLTPEMDKCYTGDLWTAAAKHWIIKQEKAKNSDKPFMMYLAYDLPHAVLELPTQAYPSGGGLHGGVQWIGKPEHFINTASGNIDSWTDPAYVHATYDDDHNLSSPEIPWPSVYKRYATVVTRIDQYVGDILQLLKDLHIEKNTLIVFTSDNGPSNESYLPKEYQPNNPSFFRGFGPFDGIKRDSWEGGQRVPAIAYWPGMIPANQIINSPSISYDWLPTFTDAAGMPAPELSDGVSLLPQLTGRGKQIPSNIYSEYFHEGVTPNYEDFAPQRRGRNRQQMQMLRLGNYVGIRYDIKSANDDFEIYDVTTDPQELNNLALQPAIQINLGDVTRFPYSLSSSVTVAQLQVFMKNRVLQERMPNASAPRPYDSTPIPPIKAHTTLNGVAWKTYSGVFPWVPQVTNLQPTTFGSEVRPVLTMVNGNKSQVVCFNGYLNIPVDGEYTFFVNTDTGAELRIHDATVADADYDYWSKVWKQGKLVLKAGLHPFLLYYKRDPKVISPSLNLEWTGPGIKRQSIPASIFSYDKS